MKTGVPSGIVLISQRASDETARMHPRLTGFPMLDSLSVAWMASRSPPGQYGGRLVWWPLRARTQHPYGDCDPVTLSLSVTEKRPLGVGFSDRPTATRNVRTVRS